MDSFISKVIKDVISKHKNIAEVTFVLPSLRSCVFLKEELIAARTKLFKYVHYTPVFKSSALDELSGAQLYFKAENLQKMGAFKMRGAMHACLSLSETQLKKGIATHSSGNFAQALSLAANKIGIEAYIVMPENAPQVKKNAVKGYKGNIIESESTPIARELMAEKVKKELNDITYSNNDKQSMLKNIMKKFRL